MSTKLRSCTSAWMVGRMISSDWSSFIPVERYRPVKFGRGSFFILLFHSLACESYSHVGACAFVTPIRHHSRRIWCIVDSQQRHGPLYRLLLLPLSCHQPKANYYSTMSGMYDEPKIYEGKLEPYPHVERPEVRID
jgi:hypothetical protein